MIKIAVIGGGAAGMMVAASIAEQTGGGAVKVILLEKNKELGRKVKISGGGRCNITTGHIDLKEVLKSYPRGAKFFRNALYNFGPEAVREWFRQRGIETKVEKDMRVFPVSDDGDDVVDAFKKIFKSKGVDVRFEMKVKKISRTQNGFMVEIEDQENLEVDRVVITTGGQAYRHTGSEGDGYSFAENLGHKITNLGPSLNSFMIKEQWVKNLSGVSFEDVRLKMAGQEFRGPILMTHKGITGPAIFALSSLCAFEKIDRERGLHLHLDFCPDLDYENLRSKIVTNIGDQDLARVISPYVTKSFVREYGAEQDLDFGKKKDEAGKKLINKAVEMLKNTEIRVVGRLPGDEFVTAGGVDLKEVDSKTMQSRVCPGLYFAGEILNIDGFTGGYNLQVAWSTGRLAGQEVCG